jgi:hypothetical protein
MALSGTFPQTQGIAVHSGCRVHRGGSGASLAGAIHNQLTIDLNGFLSILGRITAAQ